MLADKLRGAAAGQSWVSTLEYVGSYVEGFAGTTSDKVVSLTSLTGGLASAPAAGDFVVIYFGTHAANTDRDLVVAGYTEVADLYSADSAKTNLAVAYKFMSGTPDTTLTLTGGTFNNTESGVVAIQVWRNVDTITPLDVAFASATGINSVLVNPPAITPVTDGAVILAGGAGAQIRSETDTFTSSDLTDFKTISGKINYLAITGLGYKEWISGSFDPAAFSFSATDSLIHCWAAVTIALRPA